MKRSVTLLHLSDIHLCSPRTGWDADRILDLLLKDLNRMEQEQGLLPDFLVVTGDLAFGHLGDGELSIEAQYEETFLFLEEVRTQSSRAIPTDRIFLVPGNHDIKRSEVLASQTDHLDALAAGDYEQSAKKINEMVRDANGEWPIILKRLDPYREFVKRYYPHLLQNPQRLTYALQLEVGGARIGIAGLNSAWSCGRDQEKGKLWLGGRWQIQTLAKELRDCDLRVALAHHPLTWLVPQENPDLDPLLEQIFHLFLHGHEHQSWVDPRPDHVRIAAGACYGEKTSESGYSLVRFLPEEGRGEVWLRRLDDHALGWIPRAISGKTDDHGCWPLAKLTWLQPTAPANVAVPDPVAEPPVEAPPPAPNLSANHASPAEGRGVYGRDREIADLSGRLAKRPILVIYGVSGVGKSKLIREVCRALLDNPTPVPITADNHTDAERLFHRLAPTLGCHDEDPRVPRNILRQIDAKSLKQYRETEPCVIHVHRANELFGERGFRDPEVGYLLRALVQQLPQVRVILESVKQPPAGLFSDRLYEEMRIRGLDAAALQRYFRHPFGAGDPRGWELGDQSAKDLYRRLGGREQKTGAHPLGMALLASVADGLGQDPLAMARRHPLEFYKRFEERLFNDLFEQVLTEPQRHMLRLCALYRQPIPDGHADSLNERVQDDRAFDALVQRLLLSPDEAQSHYQLHALFAELARQRIGEGFDVQADHARIADAWLRQVSHKKRSSLPNILAANEAAHHLLEAEEFHRLQELSEGLLGHDTPRRLEEIYGRLYRQRDMDNYYYVLELLIKLAPEDHKAHRFFGEAIEHREGRGSERALEHYLKAFELNPTFPPYLSNIGRNLRRRDPERFVALVDGLDEPARSGVVNDHVQNIYAACLERAGRGGDASAGRQRLIREGTRNGAIFADEALWLKEQGDAEGALVTLELAEQRGVADDYTLAVKAKLLEELDRGGEASELRRARIDQGTRNPYFYNDEAIWLRDQGRFDDALELLELAGKRRCADEYIDNLRRNIEQRAREQTANAKLPAAITPPSPDFTADRTHTILVLAANPMLDLRLDEEVRTIQQGLERARGREPFHIESRPAARIADLRRALLDLDPAILHFSGHGEGEPGILLQGPDDQAVPVPGSALRNLLSLFKENLRCVVLNACNSTVQAEAISEHIPFVIGMSEAIGDEAARVFSKGFYDGLGAGKDIDTAWRLGCNALELHGIPEEHIPVLIRDGKRLMYGGQEIR